MPSKAIDVEKLNTLIEINSLINSNYSDINALMVFILESAMRLVNSESSSILLVNKKDDTLRFEVALGPKGVEASSIPVVKEGSIAGWVVKNNKPLIINDVAHDPRFSPTVQNKTGYQTKTMIAVPLRDEKNCIGVIELLNKSNGEDFTEGDLEIIKLLGEQASIAYQNADAFLKAREKITVLQNMTSSNGYHQFVAKSSLVQDLLKELENVAKTNSSVLILGESGVGKELFAEQLHIKSLRSDKPFVRVNCAALSPQLLESELFGHVKGAFTDAVANRKGRFEMADTGTIFLDEIGELPLDLQVKLLRVIQSRTFEKVGSSETIKVDVRIIAATNRDIEQMVAEGTFRSDLYYRLNVLQLNIPPLRQRKEDIMPLANFFCEKFSNETKKNFKGFSKSAIDDLLEYYWPGNVRELENTIERACVLGTPPFIQSTDLRMNSKINQNQANKSDDKSIDKSLKNAITEFKKNYVIQVLEQVSWNQTEAAKVLDIQRTYLAKLMTDLDIR